MVKPFYLLAPLLFYCLLFPLSASSEMTSTHYTIFADTFNTGGVFTTSSLYRMEGTTGESPVGASASSTYTINAGYQAMDRSQLSMTISATSLNLGVLTLGQISSASSVVTVFTDSDTGYTLSISNVSGSSLTAVADGSVTAGQEEYGLSVSGSDILFADDRSIIARNLASTSTAATSQTTLTFKAARASGSTAGPYSQTVTLSVSNNL